MKNEKLVVCLLAVLTLSGCGKIGAALGKVASHSADDATVAAERALVMDESRLAGTALSHADEGHGPQVADDAVEEKTPISDFMLDRVADVAEEAASGGFDGKDDEREPR